MQDHSFRWILGVAMLAVLGTVRVATATDRYVATTGSDVFNSCLSSDSPCLTIVRAVGVAHDFDVVHVAPGTYGGRIRIVRSISGLRIVGRWRADPASPSPTVIAGSAYGGDSGDAFEIDAAARTIDVSLEDLVMQDGNAERGGAIWASNSGNGTLSVTVLRCTFRNNQARYDGGAIYVGSHSPYTTIRILQSRFENNNTWENYSSGGAVAVRNYGGLVGFYSQYNNYANNRATWRGGAVQLFTESATAKVDAHFAYDRIQRNHTYGLGGGVGAEVVVGNISMDFQSTLVADNRAEGSAAGVMLFAQDGRARAAFVSSTITQNHGYGGLVMDVWGTSYIDVRLTNTIVWGNTSYDVFIDRQTSLELNTGDVGSVVNYGTYTGASSNVNVDPLFRAGDADYHLSRVSPLINRAICGVWTSAGYQFVSPPLDYDDQPRPSVAHAPTGCDIGADEYYPVP